MAAVKARIVGRQAASLLPLAIGVLVMHAWLLQQMPWPAGHAEPASVRRLITLEGVKASQPVLPEVMEQALPSVLAPPAAHRSVEKTRPAAPSPAPDGEGEDEVSLPVYPTRMLSPQRLRYAVRRASGEGLAQWDWLPEGERFESRLVARNAQGTPIFEWTSRGTLDATGVAPERFVDRRGGRAGQAANFDRSAGRITYSGPSVQSPLPAGAQDRLSWVAQVAAVVAAEPARWQPGAEMRLYVTGARGDAELWRLRVEGMQVVELADASAVRALKLQREPPGRFGTRVELWLDPGRGFVPVRVSWRNGEAFTELVLQPTFD